MSYFIIVKVIIHPINISKLSQLSHKIYFVVLLKVYSKEQCLCKTLLNDTGKLNYNIDENEL